MKKSYKKLILFETFVFIILLLNSFESSILRNYNMPLFIFILMLIFKFIFGYEKDKYRYKKDVIINILIDLIIYYIIFYLFGIIIGFAKNENYLSLFGIIKHILPLLLSVPLLQFLRYCILQKSGNNKLLIVSSTILFIFFDVFPAIPVADFNNRYGILIFLSLTVLPSISKNIFLTYLTKKEGYYPGTVYLIGTLYPMYLLPIVPNPNVYLKAIIDFTLPIIIFVRTLKFYEKVKVTNDVDRNYNKRNYLSLLIPITVSIVMVYLVSGYFRFYAIAVASGSMKPAIYKGDVVIVDKKDNNIQIGEVIAFKVQDSIVVHRIVNKIEDDGIMLYYTKGDANDFEDKHKLTSENIIGVVKIKIPFIGYPTVWLSNL